jgi:hypothetical protein
VNAAPEVPAVASSAAATQPKKAFALNLEGRPQVTEQIAYTRLLVEAGHAGELGAGEMAVLQTVLWHQLAGSRPKARELRSKCRSGTIVALRAKEWLGCTVLRGRVAKGAGSWFLRIPSKYLQRYSELVVEAKEEIYAFCIENPPDGVFPR